MTAPSIQQETSDTLIPPPAPARLAAVGGTLQTKPLAVVTGASSGIGLELARVLAENEYDLVIVAEDDQIRSAKEELEGYGVQVQAIQADLTRYEEVEDLANTLAGRELSVVALNAGIGAGGAFVEQSLVKDLEVVKLNIISVLHLAKRTARQMVRQGSGNLLFTSSIASQAPGPYNAVYSATKAFVQSFSQALRAELEETGVNVTTFLPGATETEFFERAGLEDTKVGEGRKDDPALVARQAYEGMVKGKANARTGSLKSRVLAEVAHALPDKVAARAQGKMNEPGTGK